MKYRTKYSPKSNPLYHFKTPMINKNNFKDNLFMIRNINNNGK